MNHHAELEQQRHKTAKYRHKYLQARADQMQGGADTKARDIDNLTIYPNIALITTASAPPTHELLSGFVTDSITLRTPKNRSRPITITAEKGMETQRMTVTLADGKQVKGYVKLINGSTIHLVDTEGRTVIIRKWLSIVSDTAPHNRPTVLTTDPGTLRYMVESITWRPIYDLYLDSDPILSSPGSLSMTAQITNETGLDLDIRHTVLLAGTAKIEHTSNNRYQTYASSRSMAKVASPHTDTTPGEFDELSSYDVGELLLDGQTVFRPLADYDVDRVTKKYVLDLQTQTEGQEHIEAAYGYTVSSLNTDLPAGIIRIYANSLELKTNTLLGSVHIPRTPATGQIETMIGSTPRIRAKITNQSVTEDFVEASNKLKHYSITETGIMGKAINDYEHQVPVILRYYVSSSAVLEASNDPVKKGSYLEWIVKLRPGVTPIDYHIKLKH
ncbi:Hypothetical protein MVR_LOCUS64 [uncultured virus]|nr:Hypothetical protein MVR_LOCUS64 [uncultured virus]